ncbi:MAG: hypothetical protein J1E34_00805 [Oscillospiraceae bacterium]|nr:hypothetical protein [Oscillospiraceae bacterium]
MASKERNKAEVRQMGSFRRKVTNIDFELRSPVIKGILIFAVLAMAAAFAIYHITAYTGSRSALKTQTALNRTITKSISAQGIVIREESVLSSAGLSGTVVPRVSNGSKVSSGDTVAEIFKSSAAAEALMEIDSLNSEIAYYEDIGLLGSNTMLPNKDSYNQNIANSLFEVLGCISENRLSDLNGCVMELSLNVTKKQIALGKAVSVDNTLSSLYARRDQLSSSISSGAAISANAAGYYVNKADGYEDITDYGGVLAITPEEVSSLLSSYPKSVSNNVGKLITQFVWYIVCAVDKADADEVSVNQKINISIAGFSGDTVSMTLAAKNEGAGDKVALVFKSNLMNSEIAALRSEDIKICLEEYSGYAVDKKALRTVDGETGVYIQLGNLVRFRKIEIAYSDDNIVLAAAKSENGYLRLYDEIITEGTDLYDGKIIA